MNTPLSTLTRIDVDSLFGSRERSYDFDLEMGWPTVLTGSNGSGKSTILRLVEAIAAGTIHEIMEAPLKAITLHFDNIPSFSLSNPSSDSTIISWGQHENQLHPSRNHEGLPVWARRALAIAPSGSLPSRREFMEAAIAADAEFDEFSNAWERLQYDVEYLNIELPSWYEEFKTHFRVLFVTDQRLVKEYLDSALDHAEVTNIAERAVTLASKDISVRIRQLDSRYTQASQVQDKRFPAEVIAAIRTSSYIDPEQVQALEATVTLQRERLRSVGLLAEDKEFGNEIPEDSLEDSKIRPVLLSFWRASLNKMQVLDDLADKLISFKDFLDDQFQGKVTEINREIGVAFRLESGQEILPSQLSSGEQQMMILAFEILFRTEPRTLVLIDEPEISLHVTWQSNLLENLARMGRVNSLQYLMATHSPTVLANQRWAERSLDDMRTHA